MIRRATIEDMDFMLEVARDRYPPFDEAAARAWGATVLESPAFLVLRGDHGFGVAAIANVFFAPDHPQARVLFVATRPNKTFEGYRILKTMAELAASLGASFTFGDGDGSDLAPIARRLGATTVNPTYTVPAP